MGKERLLFSPFTTSSIPGDPGAVGETLGGDRSPLEEELVTKRLQSNSTQCPSNLKMNTFALAFTVSHRQIMNI